MFTSEEKCTISLEISVHNTFNMLLQNALKLNLFDFSPYFVVLVKILCASLYIVSTHVKMAYNVNILLYQFVKKVSDECLVNKSISAYIQRVLVDATFFLFSFLGDIYRISTEKMSFLWCLTTLNIMFTVESPLFKL